MSSVAVGIGYSLWLQLRWTIGGLLAFILGLAFVVQLFPDAAPYCCGASVVIIAMASAFILNPFTFGPSDLGAKSSGFPMHMRVLPVSTRALVGWPMLFAAVTFATLWLVPACIIFMPAGFRVPILFPATMFVAVCTWVQAIGWSPVSSPYARVPLLFLAIAPLALALTLGATFFKGPLLTVVISTSCLAWSVAAYRFGVYGLSRARRGSEGDWFRPLAERWEARSRRRHAAGYLRRPFRSPFTAQLWHECRRNAVVLPAMTIFVGLPMLLALSIPVLGPGPQQSFAIGSNNVSAPMFILLIWGVLPLMFSLTQGSGMAKCDIWGKMAMPAFFATRPMTTSRFVLIKLCATAVSAMASWAITLGLFAIWAAMEASPLNSHPSLIRTLWAEATPRATIVLLFAIIGIIALTWRNIVSGFWPTLLGRKHLSTSIGFGFFGAYILLLCAGIWIYKHPDYQATFKMALPWIVGLAIGLKLLVAVWLSLTLEKRGLIEPMTMRLLALGWLVLASCIFGGVSLVVTPTWGIAAMVVMMVPFTSLAAAPLALQWNRHR